MLKFPKNGKCFFLEKMRTFSKNVFLKKKC